MQVKIQGGTKLTGEITPSGRKNSIVTLIPASLLFDQPVTLKNVPDITDVDRLIEIMTSLGSKITRDKARNSLTLDNSHPRFDPIEASDVKSTKGIRGTTLLWGPMLARFGRAESSEQPPGCTLGARPIDAHFQAFADLGVKVTSVDNHISLDAQHAAAGPVWLLEASPTATENAVMLAVTLAGVTSITHAASEPNVQQLCEFLNACGANIRGIGSNILTIEGGHPLHPTEFEVMSDMDEISTFFALVAVTCGEVRVDRTEPKPFTPINRELRPRGPKK